MGDFTKEELEFGSQYEALGPEYLGASKAAEEFMAKFEAEQFKPLVDKFIDEFRDRLWSDVNDFLIADTESNLHSAVRRMVEGTVQALLTGEEWAMQRYPYCDYRDGPKIRERIAGHSGDEIARQRIIDLEREVARQRELLRYR
jgi:hypothetical protein